MRPSGVHHIAIKVQDLASCERFYVERLGLPVLTRYPAATAAGGDRSVWLDAGDDAIVMLERGDGTPDIAPLDDPGCGHHLLALRIRAADRAAWRARLDVVHETAFTLYVRDPEGNRIGLSHHPETAGSD
jgi:catechol 2,3-dioxygenase-like lactoylglutathione lyase family enzyme